MPSVQPALDLPSDLIGVAIRTLIVYVVLIATIRLFGKAEIGQLSPSDLVLLLIVSNGVQNAMVGTNTSIWAGLVTVVVLFSADRVLRQLRRTPQLRRLVEGDPVFLVKDGALNEAALRREGLDQNDIDHAVRQHGYASVKDVDEVVLEVDGTVSVIAGGKRTTSRIRHRRRSNLPVG